MPAPLAGIAACTQRVWQEMTMQIPDLLNEATMSGEERMKHLWLVLPQAYLAITWPS